MSNKFAGKTIIVTGASRGIGSAIAQAFAAEGGRVVVNYAGSRGQAEAVVADIRSAGGEAIAVQADLRSTADIARLVGETLEAFGAIDVLINNAGAIFTKPIGEISEQEFDDLFAVNVRGTFFAIKETLPHMRDNGRIINFSTSVTGSMFPGYSAYAGTKGAVEQFTRQLAKEIGPRGITINAIAPGPVDTELFRAGKTEQQIEGIVKLNAFGRLGQPDDIVGMALFLASEEARWISGQTVRVNGGYV